METLAENSINEDDIELNLNLNSISLSPKASCILAIIYLNCLCSPNEKAEYINILKNNDKIYNSYMENNQVGSIDIFKKDSNNNEEKDLMQNTNIIIPKKRNNIY